ncbi:MAG: CinA family nicotinamide mononucleotide deamidase-related protein [Myxococcota bacterium]
MRAILIAIGDEVLSGDVNDSHGAYLFDQLGRLGIQVVRRLTVPDDHHTVVQAVRRSAEDADWVITTGGLGPTIDDLTMAAIAEAAGVNLVRDPTAWRRIVDRARERGREPTPDQARMADVPDGSQVLPNRVGAAPGCIVRVQAASVAVLPGPPTEMKHVFDTGVRPRLPVGGRIHRSTFRVFGLRESEVSRRLEAVVKGHPSGSEVRVGLRNVGLENRVKLSCREISILDEVRDEVRTALQPHVFSEEEADLAAVLGDALVARSSTLASAESCTAGGVGQALTAIPGSSRFFVGGIIAYDNRVKTALLGVSDEMLAESGAVSDPVARQMARGVRDRLGVSWGVSTTGIAGPGGGTADKPVGTVWIAWAGPDDAGGTERLNLPGHDRELVRRLTIQAVLGRMWQVVRPDL